LPLEHEGLTGDIIAAGIEVHKKLGSGFIESIYEKALWNELRKRGSTMVELVDIEVCYDGFKVGEWQIP